MRIIAGQLRGKKLETPEGLTTRPSPDRLRETLFQLLENRWGRPLETHKVLDLFAGSGSLGLEAISRGATQAVLVEQDAAALKTLKANVSAVLKTLGSSVQLEIRPESVENAVDWMAGLERKFDLVLTAPPYCKDWNAWLLGHVGPVLVAGGWLVIQHHKEEEAAETVKGWQRMDQRALGIHRITIYERT